MAEITFYKVGGAGCGACILKIKNIVEPLVGVSAAKFDLKHNILTVMGEHDENDVIAAMVTGKFTAEVVDG